MALVLAAVAASCSRTREPAIQRVAVLRFENLTADPTLDWMGRAASEVIGTELTGSPNTNVIPFGVLRGLDRVLGARPRGAPGVSAERSQALAAGATRIVYGRISSAGRGLRLDASVYDTARHKVERTAAAAGPFADGIIPLTDSLARQLGERVLAFETRSQQALKEYCSAVEASDARLAAEACTRSVAADPNFGAAYVAWAQLAAAQHQGAEAERILALATSRGNALSELARTRLEAVAGGLRGDFAASARALRALARLLPADLSLLRQLAQTEVNARQYQDAVENYRKVLALQSDDPVLLNQLGYAQMYAGDLAGATQSLKEYLRLRPDEANPLDSLGDAHFYLGQLGEAEKYYRQAYGKDSNFANGGELLKAAWARLMTGDIPGADGVFHHYLDARRKAKDSIVEYRWAEWEYLSGRRRTALRRLEALARTTASSLPPEAVARAHAQLAIWALQLGDRAPALKAAARAGSASAGFSALVRFLTAPPAPAAAWTARAEQAFPGAQQGRLKDLALAFALLFAQDFVPAAPVLKRVYHQSAPAAEGELPVLLAWAQVETGRVAEAAALLDKNPIPNPAGPELFASLSFPRLFFLRGAVAAKQGRRAEAERNYRLFLTLSGPDPEVFGEERRARAALGQ